MIWVFFSKKIFQNFKPIEKEIDINKNAIEALRIVVQTKKIYLVFKNIFLKKTYFENVANAMAWLFVYYFIYDIKYPICFLPILAFFHEKIFEFEEVEIFLKNNKYFQLSEKISGVN